MPDQYDPKVAARAPGRRDAPADDPLAELAKIVHGRPTAASAAAAKATARSQSVSGAGSSDLEAELLNDLQASFAAVRDALPLTQPQQPQPAPPPRQAPAAVSMPAPSLRGPIVEDSPPASVAPPASVTPPQAPSFRPPPAPRPEVHPELRDEFRLEPIDESRLVPIPSPPIIQPHIQQTSDYQPPRPERPQPERRVEPAPAVEKPADAGVERAARATRPATPPETTSDLANFALRMAARSAAAPAVPPVPPASKQAHSRWERPEPPKPQAPAPSRFAPPKSTSVADEEAERDPFADAGLLPDEDSAAGMDSEFPLDGLGMVPGYGDDDDGDILPPLEDDLDALARPRGPRRGLLIAGAVVVVALIGGIAVAMFHSGSTSSGGGTPPVIAADNSPTKVVPKPDATANTDSPNKLIYDRVNSADSGSGDDTTLVTSGDEPIQDVPSSTSSDNAITRVIIPGGPQGPADTSAAGSPAASAAGTQVATTKTPDDSLGPRKVRTVVVKPDGTIVSSQATDAPPPADTGAATPITPPVATTAPVPAPAGQTPTVSADAPAPVTPPTVASNDVPTVASPPVTDDTAAIAGGQSGPLPITDQPDTTAPAGSGAATANNAGQAAAPVQLPTPAPKPTVKPTVKAPPANAQVADNTTPIDITPGTEPAAASAGGVLVQVSSQRTEDAARATYKDLQERYPSILGRYDVNVQRADLGDRGIFYRVRVGPFSQADAQHLCDDLRSAGGDCVLTTK